MLIILERNDIKDVHNKLNEKKKKLQNDPKKAQSKRLQNKSREPCKLLCHLGHETWQI